MKKLLMWSLLMSAGCKNEAQELVDISHNRDVSDFLRICMQEGEGRIDLGAYNEEEDAIGPAQITPIYLEDSNAHLKRNGLDQYTHQDMYSLENAYVACLAYWDKYGLETLEERARAHCGGPDGPRQACTLPYWRELQTWPENNLSKYQFSACTLN